MEGNQRAREAWEKLREQAAAFTEEFGLTVVVSSTLGHVGTAKLTETVKTGMQRSIKRSDEDIKLRKTRRKTATPENLTMRVLRDKIVELVGIRQKNKYTEDQKPDWWVPGIPFISPFKVGLNGKCLNKAELVMLIRSANEYSERRDAVAGGDEVVDDERDEDVDGVGDEVLDVGDDGVNVGVDDGADDGAGVGRDDRGDDDDGVGDGGGENRDVDMGVGAGGGDGEEGGIGGGDGDERGAGGGEVDGGDDANKTNRKCAKRQLGRQERTYVSRRRQPQLARRRSMRIAGQKKPPWKPV